MPRCDQARFRQQVGFLRRQFLQGGGLPFADVLSAALVAEVLTAIGSAWYDRVYTPLVTLWVFLGQVLNPDPSCRAAVARLNAHRAARGSARARPGPARTARRGGGCPSGSSRTWPAGRARVGRRVGPEVAVEGPAGVRVRRVARLHARHPGQPGRVPAAGHPEAGPRVPAGPAWRPSSRWPPGRCWTWPSAGTPARGRASWGCSGPCGTSSAPATSCWPTGSMCAWTEMVMLKLRGVDSVCRLTSHRTADFRRGRRLGEGDHVVEWPKPNKPRSIDRAAYAALPASLTVRETRVRVEQPGFRTRALVVATTLLDAEAVTADDLARALPGAVERGARSEVVEADDADGRAAVQDPGAGPEGDLGPRAGVQPGPHGHGPGRRPARPRAAVGQLQGGDPDPAGVPAGDRGARGPEPGRCRAVYEQVLAAVAAHRVGDRPDRFEPRLRKRRPKHYAFLRQPRAEVKRRMLKRFGRK